MNLLGQLVPVERHAGLQPQRVAGSQAHRARSPRLTLVKDPLPDLKGRLARHHQFAAVFARVARATDHHFDRAQSSHRPGIVLHPRQVDVHHRRHQLDRGRTLHGDHRRLQRQVAHRHLFGGPLMLLQPGHDLVAVRGIDDHHDARRAIAALQMIHQDIVQDTTLLVGDQRVADLARLHVRDAPRDEAIEEGEGAVAGEFQAAHVRDIEHTDGRSRGHVLVHDRAVLNRHFPTREVDQAARMRTVPRMQRSSFQQFACHASPRVWRAASDHRHVFPRPQRRGVTGHDRNQRQQARRILDRRRLRV